MKKPLITIATVTYNAAPLIAGTLRNIRAQSWPQVEELIIDGASTDRTVAIARKELPWARIISGKDRGIYDAMNKALDHAQGEWIIFINAGDYLHSVDALTEVFSGKEWRKADVIYGGTVVRNYDTGYEALVPAPPVSHLWKISNFMHQSVFMRTKLARSLRFDESYRISADSDMLVRAYASGARFLRLDHPVSIYRLGGFSAQNVVAVKKEWRRISRQLGFNPLHELFFIWKIASAWVRTRVL